MEYYDVLEHHGVKGQKWGVRRYQTKSGSLTNAGKKHVGQSSGLSNLKTKMAKRKLEKATAKATKSSKQETQIKKKQKSVSEMSDAELKSSIERKRLENSYKELNPQKVSAGKKFASSVGNKFMEKSADAVADLAAQSLKAAGAKQVNKLFNSVLGDVVDSDGHLPEYVFSNNKRK